MNNHAFSFPKILFISSILLSGLCLPARAASDAPEPKTEAAILAADEHWGEAEGSGDVAYINELLLPEYRSVNDDGSVHDKEAILGSTRRNIGSNGAVLAREKYLAEHPHGTSVIIQGDMAVVTFYRKDMGPVKGITSCDIFVYLQGHWHAIYSQGTAAGKLAAS